MARGEIVTKEDLPVEAQQAQSMAGRQPTGTSLSEQVEELEKRAIGQALDRADGVQSRAADILGLTERNLRYKLKKYGLK